MCETRPVASPLHAHALALGPSGGPVALHVREFLYLAHFLGHPSRERRQLLLDVLQKRRRLWGPSALFDYIIFRMT